MKKGQKGEIEGYDSRIDYETVNTPRYSQGKVILIGSLFLFLVSCVTVLVLSKKFVGKKFRDYISVKYYRGKCRYFMIFHKKTNKSFDNQFRYWRGNKKKFSFLHFLTFSLIFLRMRIDNIYNLSFLWNSYYNAT